MRKRIFEIFDNPIGCFTPGKNSRFDVMDLELSLNQSDESAKPFWIDLGDFGRVLEHAINETMKKSQQLIMNLLRTHYRSAVAMAVSEINLPAV